MTILVLLLKKQIKQKKEAFELEVRHSTEKAARAEVEATEELLSLSLQYCQHLQKTEQRVLFWNGTLCSGSEDVERDLQVVVWRISSVLCRCVYRTSLAAPR